MDSRTARIKPNDEEQDNQDENEYKTFYCVNTSRFVCFLCTLQKHSTNVISRGTHFDWHCDNVSILFFIFLNYVLETEKDTYSFK